MLGIWELFFWCWSCSPVQRSRSVLPNLIISSLERIEIEFIIEMLQAGTYHEDVVR